MLLTILFACAPEPGWSPPVPAGPAGTLRPREWPLSGDGLQRLPTRAPRNQRRGRVYLSAGHADSRTRNGNTGVHGQIEAETNLEAVLDLARRLEALGPFDVVVGRKPGERPSYDRRIAASAAVDADVLIELHTDWRGDTYRWARIPGGWAHRADGDHGFSVLFNEGGPLGTERRDLGRAVAARMTEAGFPPYPGCHYDNYDADSTAGVFIDRRGLKMLRGPSMPSIIVETHNALDYEESLRWRESRTAEVFASAMAAALHDVFSGE